MLTDCLVIGNEIQMTRSEMGKGRHSLAGENVLWCPPVEKAVGSGEFVVWIFPPSPHWSWDFGIETFLNVIFPLIVVCAGLIDVEYSLKPPFQLL